VIPPGEVGRLFQPFQRLGAERVRQAANGASPGGEVPRGHRPGGEVPRGHRPGGEVPRGHGPGGEAPGGHGPSGEAPRGHGPGGHGLGLAIVRAIADAHGAEVTARARPEGGLDIEVAFAPGR
jgi:hypothetical protein